MAWVKSGNVKGSPGESGATGDTGAPGATGATGATGDKGDPAPNQVIGSQAGVASELTLWVGTQAQYDAAVKDASTVYVVQS